LNGRRCLVTGGNSSAASLKTERPEEGLLVLHLSGPWKIGGELPSSSDIKKEIESGVPLRAISFESRDLSSWDSGLLTFLMALINFANEKKIEIRQDGLPEGVRRLLRLSFAVAEHKAPAAASRSSFFARVGEGVTDFWKGAVETVGFIGEIAVSLLKFCTGSAKYRGSDLILTIQECGAQALPIVSLISILVGLILAFVGSIQLKMFGAQIYIADLVGIAMTRAMGAIMAGIIMAGRTGASYAARIGTMQVNEEIDALKTAGIPPIEFLVLPRIIALALMMPLLTLYADLMGIIGGMFVATVGFDITLREYLNETRQALTLTNVWIGVFSGFVYGIIIAVAGCLRGMQCGRSASAVGDATTSAVVTSIVSIIVATAIITVLCNVLGI
jgi:phospholipid/cholesterol/gamma-HCH transport system permease protein